MRGFAAGILLALFSFSLHADIDLTALNRKLVTEKIGWVASETRANYPVIPASEPIPLNYEGSEVTPLLAASLDWRSRNGRNWVGSIKDQGQCGSCVAFAAAATLETQYRIDSGRSSLNIDLSEQHLFSCGGGSCTWGWTGESASRFLQRYGMPDEACYPYSSGVTERVGSCSSTCADHSRRSIRLSGYSRPTSGSINIAAIKQALQHGPVVAMMNVYEDFQYYQSGIFKHTTGAWLGAHAVSIVGYNDTRRYFIIRNSWSSSWGENGFGRLSYDDRSGLGSSTWSYRPSVH